MRRLSVIVTVLGVILISLAAGWVAADLPYWCQRFALCERPPLSQAQKLQIRPAEIKP